MPGMSRELVVVDLCPGTWPTTRAARARAAAGTGAAGLTRAAEGKLLVIAPSP